MPVSRSTTRHTRAVRSRAAPASAVRRARTWARLPDEQLLDVRFCDLQLKLEKTSLQREVHGLYAELEGRGLRFRPHVWLAEEWFSPDGVPGIAVPFYLAHPRLARLERHMMRQVEGGNRNWLRRILRHEAGHAIDTAYRLRRRRAWRDAFGPASLPYPDRYRVRPGSRRYVHHLGEWYAQSHPTEDFAETFAVWLTPRSAWRRSYESWPALHKLAYVQDVMGEVGARVPVVRGRERIEPLDDNKRTLREHYRLKLARYEHYYRGAARGLADDLLQRIFTARPRRRGSVRAASLLRTAKATLVGQVVRDTGAERYTVYQLLRMLVSRSDALRLRVRGSRRDALRNARWMLARLVGHMGQGASTQLVL